MSHDIAHFTRKLTAALAVTAALAIASPAMADGASNARANTGATNGSVHPGTELSLRRQIVIDQDTIRLGDLFDGQIKAVAGVSADTVVAYAPQPGRRAIFDAEWLSRLAHRLRLNWRPTTRLDRVVAERTSTLINGDAVRDTIAGELAERGFGEEFDIELSNHNLLIHIDSRLPGTIGIASLSVDPSTERFNAIITVPAGDPRAKRFTVAGRMFAMLDIPVPVTTLRPGETIRPDDIVWKPVRARLVRDNTVTDADDLINMEPRRALRQDTPVRRADLRRPQTVSKGAVVTMLYQTRAMSLSATGVAESNGTDGDIIRVRNRQTKLVVDARITGPDRVEVLILPQLAANHGANQGTSR
ncbi:MAG: flagellar basal body P-ring formation protein FlgA [Rhodospirillaceae bacterium]|jgi:flagellar basal body P-ring formation protein FlgA|nr:flagellar basal body P-ring formation protein FlgA [Rhodospirillaceae bacterium]